MVISTNSHSTIQEFEILLSKVVHELNRLAKAQPQTVCDLNGTKLEVFTFNILKQFAKKTPFEGTIRLVSGQKFPDIIAQNFFGIEIKTTGQDHWVTTGNSVLESTRVENIERIYMLFGKLGGKIEFKFRLYQECLQRVVVTHSPRYLIDINLAKGETIFDKMNLPYDTLRNLPQPIEPIIDFYRKTLKPGQDLWWINNDKNEIQSTNLIIDLWQNKSVIEKQEIRLKAFVYFPEIFGQSQDKYNRIGIWFVKELSLVCTNLRDLFSAGGRGDRILNGKVFNLLPQIIIKLIDNYDALLNIIFDTSEVRLNEYWGVKSRLLFKEKILFWNKLVISNFTGNKVQLQSIFNELNEIYFTNRDT